MLNHELLVLFFMCGKSIDCVDIGLNLKLTALVRATVDLIMVIVLHLTRNIVCFKYYFYYDHDNFLIKILRPTEIFVFEINVILHNITKTIHTILFCGCKTVIFIIFIAISIEFMLGKNVQKNKLRWYRKKSYFLKRIYCELRIQ